MKCTQDNVTLLFVPDFSPATTIRRKAFNPVLKKMTALGLQPSPIRWQLNYGTRVSREVSTLLRKRRILSAPCRRGRHMLRLYRATGIQRPSSLRPGGRGLKAGMEAIPTARETMVAGWRWILAKSLFLFLFFLSSLPLGYCPYLSGTTISFLVRLTPFFSFLEGTNGE